MFGWVGEGRGGVRAVEEEEEEEEEEGREGGRNFVFRVE
jgi:hypothetical protein